MNENNHEYYEFLISRNRDSDLSNDEKLELKKHLECCCGCMEFDTKINKLSNIVKLEESPVILETVKKASNKKLNFGYKYVFSIAAAMMVIVGAAIFLTNNANEKAIETGKIIASSSITNNNTGNDTPIDEKNVAGIDAITYSINEKYNEKNSAPLAIFFDYYSDDTANYSQPMETYLTYSLSDAK